MGVIVHEYHSWKCETPGAVIRAYREAKREGWEFSVVMKTGYGYALQMKKKIGGK